jgi:5-methylcytosine-specific restriction endonuclease McrA
MNPVPKPSYGRRVAKRKERTNFSSETIDAILERDHYQCVRCGNYHVESVPHHVVYRSQLGEGSKRNGVTICRSCHEWAHSDKKKNNEWFGRWVEVNLDSEGNLKFEYGVNPDFFKER